MLGSFNAVGYDIPWPYSMDFIINAMENINIPVFSVPGFSCAYPEVSIFSVTSVYFLAPIFIGLYIFLVYSLGGRWLKMRKKPSKAHRTAQEPKSMRFQQMPVSEPYSKTPENSGFASVLVIRFSREESEWSSLPI